MGIDNINSGKVDGVKDILMACGASQAKVSGKRKGSRCHGFCV